MSLTGRCRGRWPMRIRRIAPVMLVAVISHAGSVAAQQAATTGNQATTTGNQSPSVIAGGSSTIIYGLTQEQVTELATKLVQQQITELVETLENKRRASGAAAGRPAMLRLVQVAPRLPTLNFYVIVQNEAGMPVALQSDELSARIGGREASVEISRKDEGIGIVFLVDSSASLNLKP